MATKMISRTISERKYSVICMNIKTADVGTNEYSLGSAIFRNNDAALKALRDKYETDDFKLVAITSTSSTDALYVMTEECFLKNAIRVDDLKQARAYFKEHGEEVEEV